MVSLVGSEREDRPLRATKSSQGSRKLRSRFSREGGGASLGDPRGSKSGDLWVWQCPRVCHHCSSSQTELVKVALPGKNIRNCTFCLHL